VSAKIAYLADAQVLFGISRRVFLPEPDVDSVVVRLRRRIDPPVEGDRDRIFAVIEAGFATRRKTIRNALRGAGIDADVVESALAAAGVPGGERAERLGLPEFAAIAGVLDVPRVRDR
ncbi:MAG: rRNA adenine N-6-methyltransferase family protein, partial [Actinomycetota bacterium]